MFRVCAEKRAMNRDRNFSALLFFSAAFSTNKCHSQLGLFHGRSLPRSRKCSLKTYWGTYGQLYMNYMGTKWI